MIGRLSLLLLPALLSTVPARAYDPAKPLTDALEPLELDVLDPARDRTIPVLVYRPDADAAHPAPVILFSHGLGGSRHGCSYLGRHWSARGYTAVFLQHPGSDEHVWKDVEPSQRMASMREAASGQNFLARVRDVPAVLDRLERWVVEEGHPLEGSLDLERVGMSGHSFGAVTTQALMGQRTPRGRAPFLEVRIDAAIAFSPSPPNRGTARQAYGEVSLPVLAMTGTEDGDMVRNRLQPEDRQEVYAALPPGDKFQLVFDGGRHSAFSDRPMRFEPPRDDRIHPAILAITTAFWDAFLQENPEAKAWLRSEAPRELLVDADVWEWK